MIEKYYLYYTSINNFAFTGRTARNAAHGESLLVLLPSEEEAMISELKEQKIDVNKIQVDPKKMFSPRAKIEAFLAQKQDLKESAQRALTHYVKSVILMKNKNIFKVDALNIEGFAHSLGLMFAPSSKLLQRIKWQSDKKKLAKKAEDGISKQLETKDSENEGSENEDSSAENESKSASENESSEEENENGVNFNASQSSDDEEDDFIKIKRRDHEILEETLPEVPDLTELKAKKQQQKVVTKAALAKRLIKKKILPNIKTAFDEEGNEMESANTLKSELAKEYEADETGGIDIEKARELIKEEDKYDKERFRQLVKAKRRQKKLKSLKGDDNDGEQDDFGSDDESDGPDLSFLPDPSKVYASNDDSDSDEDVPRNRRQVVNSSSESDSEDEDDQLKPGSSKQSLAKRKHDSEDDESDDSSKEFTAKPSTATKIRKITSKLSVDDVESFAMQLLSK